MGGEKIEERGISRLDWGTGRVRDSEQGEGRQTLLCLANCSYPGSSSMLVDNSENYNLKSCYFKDDVPAKANSFSVDFIFGGYFVTFGKGCWVIFNAVNSFMDRITNSDGT